MNKSFIAIDVETANPDPTSICQVGLVNFWVGKIVDSWTTYVDPEDYFDTMNIYVHGITPDKVKGAPTVKTILPSLLDKFKDNTIVHHTGFDRFSIEKAFKNHAIAHDKIRWLDTARVVRRSWEKYQRSGYGLANLAQDFGISFTHHDATEDARAAGLILLKAIEETGISLEEWEFEAYKKKPYKFASDGNPDGYLYGEETVFTGKLSVPRSVAAKAAIESGCAVGDAVTHRTTLLVIGDQEEWKLAGYEKSSKHRIAEKLILSGQSIRILHERDFFALIKEEQ